MNGEQERLARVALNHIAEPGDLRLLRLARLMGPVALHEALLAESDLDGTLGDVALRLGDAHPERRLEQAARRGIRFVVPGDAEWPVALDDLAEGPELHRRGEVPVGLWVRGPLRLDTLLAPVAIVGARAATSYGTRIATTLGQDLAARGSCVVSGAAFGIDQAAHRGALSASGPTLAVLASGVDRAYPTKHAALIDQIGIQGAIVSEAPLGASPTRIRFLARNRLIAGLCRGTVVVEAAIRSGSLNTATWADRLHRVVMGVPGPVTSVLSQGVHELLRSRCGVLVTGGADVREVIGDAGEHLVQVPRQPPRLRDELPARQRQVLDAVPVSRGAALETIARSAGIEVAETERSLASLEAGGYVEESDGRWRLGALARRAG